MSSEYARVSNRSSEGVSAVLKMFVSKLGVVKGDSLDDDMEGCGEELVLKRVCAPGGGWPKERVEIIRSGDEITSVTIGEERYALDVQTSCTQIVPAKMFLKTRLTLHKSMHRVAARGSLENWSFNAERN